MPVSSAIKKMLGYNLAAALDLKEVISSHARSFSRIIQFHGTFFTARRFYDPRTDECWSTQVIKNFSVACARRLIVMAAM